MKYNLIETATNKVIGKDVEFSEWEVERLNYGYAVNTNSRYKYVPSKTKSRKKKEKFDAANLFRYHEPI